jgi:hypothetical protein
MWSDPEVILNNSSELRQTTWQVVGNLSEGVSPSLSARNRDLWSKQGLVGQNWELI